MKKKLALGGIWLDDARIPYQSENEHVLKYEKYSNGEYKSDNSNAIFYGNQVNINTTGRFPANLLVCDDILNDGTITKSGVTIQAEYKSDKSTFYGSKFTANAIPGVNQHNDKGTYSRYFDLDKWAEDKLDDTSE